MYILLVRHEESQKNIADRFSAASDNSPLTNEGRARVRISSEMLWHYIREALNLSKDEVVGVSSPSLRAIQTADLYEFKRKIYSLDELAPLCVPESQGMSFTELLVGDPIAAWQLHLYRSGLYNAYEMRNVESVLGAFEGRVTDAIHKISNMQAKAVVIFAHRSTITAIILHYARALGMVEKGYYGFVPVDYAACSLIIDSPDSADLVFANLPMRDLSSLGVDFLNLLHLKEVDA